jgi:hypothetical protein
MLVTSRMGNKEAACKGDKKKKEEAAQSMTSDWTYSKWNQNDHLNLVVQWRPTFRQPFPQENVDEIVLFQHFVERDWPSPPLIFFVAFSISMESRSIISIQTL